jgi:hypothetical protein
MYKVGDEIVLNESVKQNARWKKRNEYLELIGDGYKAYATDIFMDDYRTDINGDLCAQVKMVTVTMRAPNSREVRLGNFYVERFKLVKEPVYVDPILARINKLYSKCKTTKHWAKTNDQLRGI